MLFFADIPQPPLPAWLSHRVLSFRHQGQGSCKKVSVVSSIMELHAMLQKQAGETLYIVSAPFHLLSYMLCRWHKQEHTRCFFSFR
jgi:hypothetical protein